MNLRHRTALAAFLLTLTFAGGVRAESKCQTADVGYEKNFFLRSCDGRYALNVKGRAQLRYAGEKRDDDAGAGTDAHSLLIRRARLGFFGNAVSPKLTYNLELDLGGLPNAADNNILYYLWTNYAFTEEVQLLAGLHKIFYNRQEITSDGKLQFVDRSLANERYKLDRSLGFVAHGFVGENKFFEYLLSVINGRNTRNAINSNQELGYVARAAFNPLGDFGYEEGDFGHSATPLLTIGGAAALWHEEASVGTGNQDRVIGTTADAGFKFKCLSVQAEAFYRNTKAANATQTDLGYFVQAGYFLIPKRVEVAVRHSGLVDDVTDAGVNVNMNNGSLTGLGGVNDGTDETSDSSNEYEYSAVANYYFKGHDVKLQAQYSLILDGIAGVNDLANHIGQVQAQVAF